VDDDVTTVLVVDDNAEVRAYVRQHLTPHYRVIEAVNGEQGLEMARRWLPDLVLSDVMMPVMDGYALCRALKTDPETDFLPIILLTARAEAEDRLAGLTEQADDYLTKPFDVRELLARIANIVTMRRRLRERFARTSAPVTMHATAIAPRRPIACFSTASTRPSRPTSATRASVSSGSRPRWRRAAATCTAGFAT
jgi:DNA-binding response OmpR family regulator